MLTGRSSLLIRYGLPLACLIATGVVFLFAGNLIRSRGEAAFITVTNDSLSALDSRMKSYTQALSGLSGFLDASNEVSALDWKRNIAALKIYDNFEYSLDEAEKTKSPLNRFLEWMNTDDTSAKKSLRDGKFGTHDMRLKERVDLVSTGLQAIGLIPKRLKTMELISLY